MYSQFFAAAAAPPAQVDVIDTNPEHETSGDGHAQAGRRDRQRRYPQANLFNQESTPTNTNPQTLLSQTMLSPIPTMAPIPPVPQKPQPQQPQQIPQDETEKKEKGVDIPIQAASINDRKGSYVYETYQPDKRPVVMPPPPSTQLNVQVVDCGNCRPEYIRMSTYGVPSTRDMNDSIGLHLGAIVSPLAVPVAENANVVTSVKGPYYAPVRCSRCGAYVNAHTVFVKDGTMMKCPLCNGESAIPDWYFSPLDMNGDRADAKTRPELVLGTVEYDVTDNPTYSLPTSYIGSAKKKAEELKAKQKIKSQALEFLCFVIDISGHSLLSGLVSLVSSVLRQAIADGTIAPNAQIAFITYNKAVHFWELVGARKRPALHTVLDTRTTLIPRGNFFVSASDIISSPASAGEFFLSNLTRLGQSQSEFCKNGDSALATALSCALNLVKSETFVADADVCGGEIAIRAGKIVLFHATTPVSEPGKIVLRDSVSYYGTEFEPSLFMAYSPFYESFGDECVKYGIGVDTFLFSTTYIDVASIGRISQRTGGQLHYFHRFDVARDAWKVEAEIRRTFIRARGSSALLRVRVSKGLSVTGYTGLISNTGEPDTVRLATVDADKAFGVSFKYDSRSIDSSDGDSTVVVQSVLLYTDVKNGCRRRLRTSTLRIPISICDQGVFNGADRDATLAFAARIAAEAVLAGEKLPTDIFNDSIKALVGTLSSYRYACSRHSPISQLVLPESLALLPLSVLSFSKMPLLKKEIKPDLRCTAAFQLLSERPAITSLRFHPRVYSLCGNKIVPLRLSMSALDQDGVYFVDDGLRPIVWIGKNPRQDVLQDLFGDAASSRNCAVLTQKLLTVLQSSDSDEISEEENGNSVVENDEGKNKNDEGDSDGSSDDDNDDDESDDNDDYTKCPKTPSGILRLLVKDAAILRGHANFAVTVANDEEGSYPSIWQILIEDSQGSGSQVYSDFLRTLHSTILRKVGQEIVEEDNERYF